MQYTENQYPEGDFHDIHTKPRYTKPSNFIHKDLVKQTQFPYSLLITPVELPAKNLDISIVTLKPGQQTELVRHTYENIIYILEGRGYSEIEGVEIDWKKGDALYIPGWAWHGHQNLDLNVSAKFIVCTNYPQLQHLGLAMKEVDTKGLHDQQITLKR